jgi:hypothetical protein
MLEFHDKLHRCAGCTESWVVPNTLKFWYLEYHKWIGRRECEVLEDRFDKIAPELDSRHPTDTWNNFIFKKWFYPCLEEWLQTEFGEKYNKDILWDGIIPYNRKIIGYRQSGNLKTIDKVAI